MSRCKLLTILGIVASLALTATPTPGQVDVAVSITGNNAYGSAAGSWGWQFATTTDLSVTALGVYDRYGTGLPEDTTVGIWRESDQALVGSTVVATNGTLIGGFRYQDVTPFVLSAAETYRIVFWNPNDFEVIGFSGQGVSWAPQINYLDNGVYNYDNGSFSYPNFTTGSNLPKYFGPNFQFSAVPEPGSLALLSLGLGLGLAVARARFARKASAA